MSERKRKAGRPKIGKQVMTERLMFRLPTKLLKLITARAESEKKKPGTVVREIVEGELGS